VSRPSELRLRAAGALGRLGVPALFGTTRIQRSGEDHFLRFRQGGKPVIFVFWHGHMLPLIYCHRREGVTVLVSDHADGEYATRVLAGQGFRIARGSSTRGGAKGIRRLLETSRAGGDVTIAPDGPQGPARVFKPSALLSARATGVPVIPVAASAHPAWRLRSWDSLLVPKPFARIRVAYGEPRWVPAEATTEELAAHARELQETMNRMCAELDAELLEGKRPSDDPPRTGE
jgi:lysophospholipid acyltransferase (LPLAT)-like uncharacterized protein